MKFIRAACGKMGKCMRAYSFFGPSDRYEELQGGGAHRDTRVYNVHDAAMGEIIAGAVFGFHIRTSERFFYTVCLLGTLVFLQN